MADGHFGYITIDKETLGLKYVTPWFYEFVGPGLWRA